jgi:hypothetical protein
MYYLCSRFLKLRLKMYVARLDTIATLVYNVWHMRGRYDIDEIVSLAQQGLSAAAIKDELWLPISERQVQRLVRSRLGARPTRRSIAKPDVLRSRVAAYMKAQGLDPHYCALCNRWRFAEGFIHALNADQTLDVLVFVCQHCSVPGDV